MKEPTLAFGIVMGYAAVAIVVGLPALALLSMLKERENQRER